MSPEIAILQNIILVLIQVSVPVLLAFALAEWKRGRAELQKRQDWQQVEAIVSRAVQAAEQLGLSDQLADYAESKLDAAIRLAEAELTARGLPLDVDEFATAIRSLIESEVNRMNNGGNRSSINVW
jgi:hypothetical protein